MLVSEFLAMAKDMDINSACLMLCNDLEYLEINHGDVFKEMWKDHSGTEMVISKDKESKTGWYYEIYFDQSKLATEGAKPIDFKPINNIDDIKSFLKEMYNLSENDRIDQWSVKINS